MYQNQCCRSRHIIYSSPMSKLGTYIIKCVCPYPVKVPLEIYVVFGCIQTKSGVVAISAVLRWCGGTQLRQYDCFWICAWEQQLFQRRFLSATCLPLLVSSTHRTMFFKAPKNTSEPQSNLVDVCCHIFWPI